MKINIFNINEFQNFIYKGKGLPNILYTNLDKEFDHFSWDDLSTCFAPQQYLDTLRYIVITNDKNIILGISKIAVFESSKHSVSCSYLNVNKNFRKLGISKILINAMLEFIKTAEIYSNKPYNSSQYSVSGWKYLRKNIIQKCTELNLIYIDNIVGFPDKDKNNKPMHDEEFYRLCAESKEIIKKLYPEKAYYYF
jgi:hypothetical protein